MNVEWSDEALSNLASIESTLAVRIKQSVDRLAETGKGDVKSFKADTRPNTVFASATIAFAFAAWVVR